MANVEHGSIMGAQFPAGSRGRDPGYGVRGWSPWSWKHFSTWARKGRAKIASISVEQWVAGNYTDGVRQVACFYHQCLREIINVYWPCRQNIHEWAVEENWRRTSAGAAKKNNYMELAWTHSEKKWWKRRQPGTTVHSARPRRKRTSQQHLEEGSGKRNVDGGLHIRYSWRKMETAAENRAGWSREAHAPLGATKA